MMNRFFALLILLFLLPILIIIALLIIIEDGLPVLFKQQRVGANNQLFIIYKFRTMTKFTPNVATHLLNDPDKYVLQIGSVLRKLSLDEIPNLINIIKGEMVFVGPRPALFNQIDLIELRNNYGINELKPGITGWAQINGRDDLSLDMKVKFEREYLLKRSLLFDLKILILTCFYVVNKNGISH